jgi:hypothetical protein
VSLYGLPLLLASLLATAGALAATVLLWRRVARWQVPLRAACLLGCELIALVTAGLIVNRKLDLYPTWRSLAAAQAGVRGGRTAPGRLDPAVPAAGGGFDVAVPPYTLRVTVPAEYRHRRTARYPVLAAVSATPPPAVACPAVTVWVPPGAAGALPDLPARLAAELRVYPDGWAVVAADPDAVPAVAALATRYRAIALAGQAAGGQAALAAAASAGVPVRASPAGTSAALAWACGQLPPPLGPPWQVSPDTGLPNTGRSNAGRSNAGRSSTGPT